jgi:enolase
MIAPIAAKDMKEAMKWGMEVYNELKKLLKKSFGIGAIAVGDEGGFAPNVVDMEEPLKQIMQAIKNTKLEGKIGICMDVAASEFYDEKKKMYNLKFKHENGESQLITGE